MAIDDPFAKRCAMRWPKRWAAIDEVFLMGEEVAQYQGAYKDQSGIARRIRREAG